MIKIRKEHTELLVTNGQYNNLYKGLGFEIVNDNKEISKPKVEEIVAKEPEKREEPLIKKTKGQNHAIQNRK